MDRAIRSRRVEGVNGLSMHCFEAGEPGRPCVLLHGFPELAYSSVAGFRYTTRAA